MPTVHLYIIISKGMAGFMGKWKSKYLIAIIFVGIICGVFVSTFFFADDKGISEIMDNFGQILGGEVSYEEGLANVISSYEETFNRNLQGIRWLAVLDNNTTYFAMGDVHSTQVILGKEDWLFYNSSGENSGTMADYRGIAYFTEEEMQQIRDNLILISNEIEERGMQFVLLVCPNKEQVYKRYMPENIARESEISRVDVLIDYLRRETDIVIAYPKEELQRLSEEYQLYYKYDSHWNLLGGFVGTEQVMKELYDDRKCLESYTVKSIPLEWRDESCAGDLAGMIGMKWYFDTDVEYYAETIMEIDNFDFEKNELYNVNGEHDEVIFLLGDSFRRAMEPTLEREFKTTYICKRNQWRKDSLEISNPDIFILEIVEREVEELKDLNLFD